MSTLANARDVLRLMAHLQRDVTVTDVAGELGLPKSSVSRTLSMMAEYGFLERDPLTRAYRPGELIMEASYHFRASRGTVSLLEEEAARLVADTGYTGYVDVLDGSESLVLHMRVSAIGALHAYTPAGTRAPAYASSMGRALLARLEDAEVMRLVDDRLKHSAGAAPKTRRSCWRSWRGSGSTGGSSRGASTSPAWPGSRAPSWTATRARSSGSASHSPPRSCATTCPSASAGRCGTPPCASASGSAIRTGCGSSRPTTDDPPGPLPRQRPRPGPAIAPEASTGTVMPPAHMVTKTRVSTTHRPFIPVQDSGYEFQKM